MKAENIVYNLTVEDVLKFVNFFFIHFNRKMKKKDEKTWTFQTAEIYGVNYEINFILVSQAY